MDANLAELVVGAITTRLMRIASRAVETGEDRAADDLRHVVRLRLAGDENSRMSWLAFEQHPHDRASRESLIKLLQNAAGKDRKFAGKLHRIVRKIDRNRDFDVSSKPSGDSSVSVAVGGDIQATGSYIGVGRIDQRRTTKIGTGWIIAIVATFIVLSAGAGILVIPSISGGASSPQNGSERTTTVDLNSRPHPCDIFTISEQEALSLRQAKEISGQGGARGCAFIHAYSGAKIEVGYDTSNSNEFLHSALHGGSITAKMRTENTMVDNWPALLLRGIADDGDPGCAIFVKVDMQQALITGEENNNGNYASVGDMCVHVRQVAEQMAHKV